MMLKYNPKKVGQLELGWWRAHHIGDKQLMFKLLVEQHQEMYGMGEIETIGVLDHLAQGIKSHDYREWRKAMGHVKRYYAVIKSRTKLVFDPSEMAKLEVGWWQLHDRLENDSDKTQLGLLFAALYATQFGLEIESVHKAGMLKAEATREHDQAEIEGISNETSEGHWAKAGDLLVDFYTELKRVVNP